MFGVRVYQVALSPVFGGQCRYYPSCSAYALEALERHGAHCEVKQQLGHPTTVFRMVEAGIGISVMPELSLPPEGLPQLVVRPLAPRVQRAIMLIRRRNRALSPLAERVWGIVRETAALSASAAPAPATKPAD